MITHFYEQIQGWSTGIDYVYANMVREAHSTAQSHFVEVGSWRGRSTAFMAVEIANSGKPIRFDCVDTWQGSVNEQEHQNDLSVQQNTLYEEFLENMKPVIHLITPVRADSVAAAAQYEDASLDFVFIDADHSYEACRADCVAWWPKIKQGGVLAGHDYNAEGDYGVGKAVRELYSGNIFNPPYCWIVPKK